MWLETIAALMFVLGLWPLWFLGAIGWGLVKGGISLLGAFLAIASGEVNAEEFLGSMLMVVFDAASAAWSVPSWAWSWAKFEHPWIAAILGLMGLASQSRR